MLHRVRRRVAIFHIITYLIHAMAAAIAGLAVAILSHLLPVLLIAVGTLIAVAVLCTSCGIRGFAFLRRRKQDE